MLKYLFLILTCTFLSNIAKGERADTTIIYFRNFDDPSKEIGYYKVSTLDSADFFRMVLPPDSADTKYNIREYYKDGKIKLVGKSDPLNEKFKYGIISWTGNCIRYYPNGKRKSITDYNNGNEIGDEYLFYPNGSIYCYIKHKGERLTVNEKSLKWECYDATGAMICKDGNGDWLTYDEDYKNVLISGKVKNGIMDWEWDGRIMNNDSVKYVYIYENGDKISSIGYDKAGIAYPFSLIKVGANYSGGINTFVDDFNRHLKVPLGPDGKKIPLDSVKVSFIVDRKGNTSSIEALGIINPDLNHALSEALRRCGYWTPTRFCGIPYRTKITFLLKYSRKPSDNLTPVEHAIDNLTSLYYPIQQEMIGN